MRVTKDEVLDLPPKLYQKRYVELTMKQKRHYNDLKTDYVTLVASGEEISAEMAVTRMLRLQQIVCGYLPFEDGCPEVEDIPGGNPRLSALVEMCDDLAHQAIIWARFRADIDRIMSRLEGRGVRVDGSVVGRDRQDAIEAFKEGTYQFLVANPAAAGTGYTLTEAKTVFYYSNSFKLVDRLQSEDRAHRIGQENAVEYVDFVAAGTIDQYIVKALREKLDVASYINGDILRDWI
jgi:SNF2 family DNA or RNA helicase